MRLPPRRDQALHAYQLQLFNYPRCQQCLIPGVLVGRRMPDVPPKKYSNEAHCVAVNGQWLPSTGNQL